MCNWYKRLKIGLQQTNRDGGDNVGRDKITNNYLYGLVEYQQLLADIKDKEEELTETASERTDLRLKRSDKLNKLRNQRDDFKAEVIRIHEWITSIPINTERLRQAKAHFDRGEFREAYAVLKVEEISAEVAQRKARREAALETVAAMDSDLADLANEFLLKARLSLVNPAAEGESRFKRTEQYFEQALAAARTAKVLFAYAKFLQEHNAFSKAEPLYQEALQHFRRDAETEPKAFVQKVADTLNNLAILHTRTQDYDQAMNEFKEALEITRRLAEVEPKAFLPKVAMTLNNLAALHYQAKEHDTAMKDYKEALEIRRSLAKTEPKVFFPDVAATLNNIANLHAQAENYGTALKEYKKALKLYRCLAKAEPKTFLPYVATTLNNLAVMHQTTQDYGPALKEFEEALKIRRNLAETEPKTFLPDVAMTLNNLAILHSNTQEHGPALKEYEEALKLYRSLAEAEPKAFLPALTETLINLSIFYFQAVPDKAKSVAYAEEARSILIPLCAQAPHLQKYLDEAERLLKANGAGPAA